MFKRDICCLQLQKLQLWRLYQSAVSWEQGRAPVSAFSCFSRFCAVASLFTWDPRRYYVCVCIDKKISFSETDSAISSNYFCNYTGVTSIKKSKELSPHGVTGSPGLSSFLQCNQNHFVAKLFTKASTPYTYLLLLFLYTEEAYICNQIWHKFPSSHLSCVWHPPQILPETLRHLSHNVTTKWSI